MIGIAQRSRGRLLSRGQHRRRSDVRGAVNRRVAVAPGLGRYPFDCVVAVRALLVERLEVAFGRVSAAAIADHDRVAALGQFERAGHHRNQPSAGLFLVVGSSRHDARHGLARLIGILRSVQVGAQDDAVPHRDFDVLLHDYSFDCHVMLRSRSNVGRTLC